MLTPKKLVLALSLASACTVLNAQNQETYQLNISDKDAGSALISLGKKSGCQIVFSGDSVRNIKVPSVVGEYTLQDALSLMLKDSGLTYKFVSDNSVLISQGEEAQAEEKEEIEEIVVTGSSLKKQDPSAPLTVYTKEEIERRGISSVEDFVRSLSGNQSSLNDATSLNIELPEGLAVQPMFGYNVQGESAANLRGMGVDSTLILVNGRRVPKSPTVDNSFVDLNGIPFSAIERVEVLMDAASAKYGSDAVGGVINFILKKHYIGAETKVRIEDSKNGGDKYNLSQLLGFSWESGSAMLTLSKDQVKPTLTKKADWTTMDLRAWGGTDQRNTTNTQPGVVYAYERVDLCEIYPWLSCGSRFRDTWVNKGSLPEGHDGLNFTLDDLSKDNIVPTDNRLRKTLSTERDRESVYLTLDQDFSEQLSGYLNVNYTKNTTVAEQLTPVLSSYVVPESNYYNNTGDELKVSYAFDNEVAAGLIPQSTGFAESKMLNASGGLKYDLGINDWTIDLNLSYGQSSSSTHSFKMNTRLCDGLRQDYNTDVDGDGDKDFVCRSRETGEIVEDPSNFWAIMSSSDPDIALNPFGSGILQSSQLFSAYEHFESYSPVNTEYSIGFLAEGEAFELPGGTMRLAVGADHHVSTQDLQDPTRAIFTRGEVKPQQYLDAIFMETSIPLVGKNNAIPGVQMLELNLQARYSDYNVPDAGAQSSYTNTTPRVGLSWRPHDDVLVRGSWTQGFRAPANTEIIGLELNEDYVNGVFLFDPYNPEGASNVYVSGVNWNGDAWWSQLSPWPRITDDPNEAILTIPALQMKPETSDNYTLGIDWLPAFMDGLEVSATYNRIEYNDRIAAVGSRDYAPEILMNIPGYALRDPETGKLVGVRTGLINVGQRLLEAVDFKVSYDFDSAIGHFRAGLNGTYTGTLDDIPVPGMSPASRNGVHFGPDIWRGRAYLDWYEGDYSATFTVNYSSSYEDIGRYADAEGNWVEETDSVEGYTTFDLTGRYSNQESGWTVLAGVRNLLDADFPFINGRYGRPWDFQRVNARGRIMYMELKKSFDL
ncbi:TonB-dependent receptor [Porticoccaceae bacterium LTM1]|nr:TonB-dependent receptor [Porticoccaceae bacterium LTM1]